MVSAYTQDTRLGSFKTPLGENKLVLQQFTATEAMSDLFEFRIAAISGEGELDFDKAIGRNCTLTMKTIDGESRYFDGLLTEAQLIAGDDEGLVYLLILRPWLWLLSKRRNSLIFHDKTAPEIIKEVFNRHAGVARFEQALSKSYPKLEYCVQYRESDMDFARRLMEEHGISFHFRHEPGKHTLVMGDGMLAYKPIPGGKRPFVIVEKRHQRETEHFFTWFPARKLTIGQVILNDYDFKRPAASMLCACSGDAKHANGMLEDYDYPGRYVEEQAGNGYAQARLDSARATDGRFHAEGDCLSCTPGSLMTLTDHPLTSHNRKYLALRCTHTFSSQAYRSKRQIAQEDYRGDYEFIDLERAYAPEAVTSKPYLRGPQTAVVVGDGEIDCDKYGRIKVQFHWDRENDHSMWVRVAQVWASDKWGGVFIPRVGMEVIVDFLEGDPDRPIIVGCVYNAQNMPPYDLPGQKNLAGWKSNSTAGGDGYNEIVMDDTKGDELLRIHAQHDLDTTVEHDERRLVRHDRETTIDVDDTLNVGNELFIEAKSKITLKVGNSTLVMDPTSITLKSLNITTEADANLETNSKGLAKHNADGMMTITSVLININ